MPPARRGKRGSSRPSSSLRRSLRRKSSPLSRRFGAIEKKVSEDLLPFVLLPDYTDHGVKHAQTVEHNVSLLIPGELLGSLTSFEIFALLCGCLLHDVGMMVKKAPDETAHEIRIDHYNRSREFVLERQAELGLSPSEARAIGEICRAHGMPDLGYLRGGLFPIRGRGQIRLELLCALLRLADALDITAKRAPGAVALSRRMRGMSSRHWDVHACISEVQIRRAPSWDIRIIGVPSDRADERGLCELRNGIQNELDTVGPILRSAGIFFKKVDLALERAATKQSIRTRRNPFLRLASYGPANAGLFAGRQRETDQLIERILRRQVVVLIGESGVGKTSLVEAGVIPRLKTYGFGVVRFSLQRDPIRSLHSSLAEFAQGKRRRKAKRASAQRVAGNLGDRIRAALRHQRSVSDLLIIGDHLEQMFTVELAAKARARFVETFSRLISDETIPATLLFCIRQDYLPDLYDLSQDIPELYERTNTLKIHKLSSENGREVLQRASQNAKAKLSAALIERIVNDLCDEGDGTVYPPFLQIVGYQLYAAGPSSRRGGDGGNEIPESLYHSLGGVPTIVNRYFEGLLDHYPQKDKPIVGQILEAMVTEYYTKRRVTLSYLKTAVPECPHLEQLLRSLVQHRIVRRSLGEYELIHDFLAHRVIELVKVQTFLSRPVRRALAFMRKRYSSPRLTSARIAAESGVSQMHLAALFRKQLARTINQQLNALRVAAAKEMISQSRDPLSDIARLAGFRSLSAFSRKFKQLEGVAPSLHRKLVIESRGRS